MFSIKVSLLDVITFYTETESDTDKSKLHLQIKSKVFATIPFRIPVSPISCVETRRLKYRKP